MMAQFASRRKITPVFRHLPSPRFSAADLLSKSFSDFFC